jgi:rfaE bifunctional protein nucleotidyltransferase chain/domain
MGKIDLDPTKLFEFSDACARREKLRKMGKRVVLTNGCFDLLHAGHVFSLEHARNLGDSLWVAVNSDASVRQLKGPSRPIFDEITRVYMLSALAVVDGIFIFPGQQLGDEILEFRPDVYAKSDDYTMERLNSREKEALDKIRAKICFIPFLEGFGTTAILQKVSAKISPPLAQDS